MIKSLKLENILFLDIETVPEQSSFKDLGDLEQELWEQKSFYQRKDQYSAEEYYEHAGIWAEFGRIICISVGYFNFKDGARAFRLKSYSGDEVEILKNFKELLDRYFNFPQHLLCAHNGKEFDFPYISRRMIINNIDIPDKLNLFGRKPWEVAHLDTMELWKFGDYKNYTSLKLLAHVLDIPSPKDDIDGSDIYRVYYEEGDLERIISYCERDTITVAQILLRLRNEPLLEESEIVYT